MKPPKWYADSASTYRWKDYKVCFDTLDWSAWCFDETPRVIVKNVSMKAAMKACEESDAKT